MWAWYYVIVGFLFLILVVLDIYTTSLAQGKGLISDWIGSGFWVLFLKRHYSVKNKHRHVLQEGIIILLTTITVWIFLLWTGWFLVFCGSENALVNSSTLLPASILERFYFAGYTVFTLGLGDFKPITSFFRICTSLAALTGLFFITFSITFITPVLQSGVARRSLAIDISGLGKNAEQIISLAVSSKSSFEQQLISLASRISLMAERYNTYSMLRYFMSAMRNEAIAPNIASLYEALCALQIRNDIFGDAAVKPALSSIRELLVPLEHTGIKPAKEAPQGLTEEQLAPLDISGSKVETYKRQIEEDNKNRRMLYSFVNCEGWQWSEVKKLSPLQEA